MRGSLEELAEAARRAQRVSYVESPVRPRLGSPEHNGLLVCSILCCVGGGATVSLGLYLLVAGIRAWVIASGSVQTKVAQTTIDWVTGSAILLSLGIMLAGFLMITLGLIGIVVRDVAQRLDT